MRDGRGHLHAAPRAIGDAVYGRKHSLGSGRGSDSRLAALMQYDRTREAVRMQVGGLVSFRGPEAPGA